MEISDEALDEFIAVYKKEFRCNLKRNTALEMAERVLRLYHLLSMKLPSEDNEPR